MKCLLNFLGCSILLLNGCSKTEERVKTYPVSGQVIYDGKPAEGVNVYLIPTSAPTVPEIPINPHGVTSADGRFNLETYGQKDGAAEGGYQVVLTWPVPPKEGEEESKEDRLQGWYSGVHSKLTAQIKPGDNTLPVFNLPFKKGKPSEVHGIPGKN